MPPSSAKAVCLSLAALLLLGHCVTSLIIPEELPTILSLIYSNIPPVRKGTDSRFGVGFRLGEHADFQVLVELGPQIETDPIGNDVDSKRKRAAIMSAAMRGELGPWAQSVAKYQMEQKVKKILEHYKLNLEKSKKKEDSNKSAADNTEGSEWLSKWSQGLSTNSDAQPTVEKSSFPKVLPTVNRMKVVNSESSSSTQNENNSQNDLKILQQLFGNNKVNETVKA